MRLLLRTPIQLAIELVGVVGVAIGGNVAFAPLSAEIAMGLTTVLVVATYLGLVHALERRPVTELGPEGAAREVGAGLLLGAALFAATIGLIALAGGYSAAGARSPWVLLGPVPLALASGITEEIVLRGVVFRLLQRWLGTWVALGLSAALFGALHLGNEHATPWAAVAIALEAGVLLAAAFMATRRLWLPMAMHVAWNWTQSAVFGVAVSGVELRGWLRGELHGPTWLTGGDFGPEASIVAIAVCGLAAVVLLRRAARAER